METENNAGDMGRELGYDGVDHLVKQVEGVCVHERNRIELTNESKILGLRTELAVWADRERNVRYRLRLAPPPGDVRSRRRKAWIAGIVAFTLTIAGFFFSLLAFDPFRLGWKSYLYCLGVAIVAPFGIEKCLEEWDSRHLVRATATVVFATALTSLVLLAVIRGDLFSQQLRDAESPVLITGDSTPETQTGNDFYKQTLPLLQIVMAFLAVAMELGAGLALHDAKRCGMDSGEDAEALGEELEGVRLRMVALIAEIRRLMNEGQVFEERFWRDFYRAVLTHTARRALGKLFAVGVCIFLLPLNTAKADSPNLTLVIAIDLSASVRSTGPDGKTDFEKNVAAVTGWLAEVPAGSKITVLGITEDSFAEPDILLSAEVGGDRGYFGERLNAARRQLVHAWQVRSANLKADAPRTDIVGALFVASQLFQQDKANRRKLLVVYSDMRQFTPELNLEAQDAIPANAPLIKIGKTEGTPDLKGVEVEALGVDAAGKNLSQWQSLRQFWTAYFERSGARLESYSVLRANVIE